MKTTGMVNLSQRFVLGLTALLLALTVAVVPLVASAQSAPTERSIQLSSSSAGATNVQYVVSFTPTAGAEAFALNFCQNTPLIGQTCEAPDGFDSSVATTADGAISTSGRTANLMVVTPSTAMTANNEVTVTLNGVTNPGSAEDALFARIVTYAETEDAEAYTATNIGEDALDRGSVAIAITPTIGVSGTVLETLMFCVSGAVIEANCANANETAPVVRLGQEFPVGSGIFAMSAGTLSEGDIYTQITTNAAGGAVIRLKSSAACGGLLRAGTDQCDIAAALDDGVSAVDDSARFGVRAGAPVASTGVTNPTGTLVPFAGSFYANEEDAFAFNFVEGGATGVTSPFGDEFLSTAGAPANNQNVTLTFGATVGNDTPAGQYSTDITLIAVGKF